MMVAARDISSLSRRFQAHNISYEVVVPDVQKLIQRNEGKPRKRDLKGLRLRDDPILDSERRSFPKFLG